MAGQIKKMIEIIIEKRSQGNEILKNTTKVKLMLKGVDIDKYSMSSEDDPAVITKLKAIATELSVSF